MNKKLCLIFFVLFSFCFGSYADGVTLGGTRLIYNEEKKEASIPLKNDGKSVPQLVQAWVSDRDNKTTDIPFIVIPPVSKLSQNSTVHIRVIFIGDDTAVPADRESQWLLNVRTVPATEKKDNPQRVTVATQNIIKLIYRPAGLSAEEAVSAGGKQNVLVKKRIIHFDNPTPYVITLADMKINNNKIPRPGTIQPYSKLSIPSQVISDSGVISYRTVNDFGGLSQEFQVKF